MNPKHRETPGSDCVYCGVVNKVCFWGPRRVANWKRPLLIAMSAVLAALVAVLIWLAFHRPPNPVAYLFGVPILAFTLLGLLVGISGCRACVARMCGDFDIHI